MDDLLDEPKYIKTKDLTKYFKKVVDLLNDQEESIQQLKVQLEHGDNDD